MREDILIERVTKIFQTGIRARKKAVDDLSLAIPSGQIMGLLGANGSGKSTTLKMILGFLKPTRGNIWICGRKAGTRESRRQIGYLPENPRFQPFLSGQACLRYFGRLHGLRGRELETRIQELLELVDLSHAGSEKVRGYSKGMTQRLAIAQALINRPKILLFDEPMSGLDPLGRLEIRNLILRIHRELADATLFFSTHILSDVEALCSWVALLKKGRLEVLCPLADLLKEEAESYAITTDTLPSQWSPAPDIQTHPSPLGKTLLVPDSKRLVDTLQRLQANGSKILSLTSKRKGLEEVLFSDRRQPA